MKCYIYWRYFSALWAEFSVEKHTFLELTRSNEARKLWRPLMRNWIPFLLSKQHNILAFSTRVTFLNKIWFLNNRHCTCQRYNAFVILLEDFVSFFSSLFSLLLFKHSQDLLANKHHTLRHSKFGRAEVWSATKKNKPRVKHEPRPAHGRAVN